MAGTQIVTTSAGPVEIRYLPSGKAPLLVFPGGHCSAATPTGEEIYADLGYGVVCFSRPGYGRTEVGALTAAEFVPLIVEVSRQLGIERTSGVVGVSFGGLQAIHTALAAPELAPRLVLHSCAPSALAYPDLWRQRVAAPLVFGPVVETMTWAGIRRLVASDAGLKIMMRSLTRLPDDQWWPQMTSTDRACARAVFNAMESGYGFRTDIRQATRQLSEYRARIHALVDTPTLVTASRSDAGVSFRHAQDFAASIRSASLVETTSPTHLYWIGPGRPLVAAAVAQFLGSA